jgi:Ca-activated chloride channel family protein
MRKNTRTILIFVVLLGLVSGSCVLTSGPPRNAEIIEVTAGTSLQTWLDQAVEEFNGERIKSDENKAYYVEITYMDAGQAVVEYGNGKIGPALWIPDTDVWVELMGDQGGLDFGNDCESVAQSPLVIGMWQPIAEALGWPGRDLGWLDIGSLAADPSAWEYYSGGQYGPSLRIGHAHPGLSSSGTSTLLAVIHAAESKQTAVQTSEIEEPIVQASVSAFESAVAIFSRSTAELGTLMSERGVGYLGASVMYENIVFEYLNQDPAIVPIYPLEGTFVADFPACINTTASAAEEAGALAFRKFLLGDKGQELASEAGLRTENGSLPDMPYLQPDQPEVIFEAPSVDTVYAVQSLWDAAKKAINLVLIIDTSGSMSGSKIAQVQEAATEFIETMGEGDYLSLVVFDQEAGVVTLMNHAPISSSRQRAVSLVQSLTASGATPLYDSIGISAEIIASSTSSQTSNALVVLTDGVDTSSYHYNLDENLANLAMGNQTSIFTIAFGKDADEDMLSELAFLTNGNFYQGDQTNISQIYQEMSVIFGGSVGIGR